MQRLLGRLADFLTALIVWTALACAQTPPTIDPKELQQVIENQIRAFQADDGPVAYSYAAPAIKRLFPSPEIFMDMVRKGYPPVYRPRQFSFDRFTEDVHGRPTLRVAIIDARGKAWVALYAFERQADGSWKIIACTLIESPSADA